MTATTCPPVIKSVLVCPGCGRESPVDGDWTVTERDGRRRVYCPACGELLVAQPVFELAA